MLKFVLYGLLIFLVIQMIRTTMRIRTNVRQGKGEEGNEDAPKKPVINIPDIQDAKFEDIPGLDEDGKDTTKNTSTEAPKNT
jgi:hypothetical protein